MEYLFNFLNAISWMVFIPSAIIFILSTLGYIGYINSMEYKIDLMNGNPRPLVWAMTRSFLTTIVSLAMIIALN